MVSEAFSISVIAAQIAALDPLMVTCASTIMVFLLGVGAVNAAGALPARAAARPHARACLTRTTPEGKVLVLRCRTRCVAATLAKSFLPRPAMTGCVSR